MGAAPGSDEAQAELLAQVEAILGCVPDGVIVYDAEGRIVRSNAAADAILGDAPDEPSKPVTERLASTEREWLTSEGRPMPLDALPAVRAARHGETHRGVQVRLRAGGVERWLTISAAPLLFDGQRRGAVATVSDITDRKRAEEALRRSEDQLRQHAELIEYAPVLVRNTSDEIVTWSQGMERLYGWTRAEAIGKVSHHLFQTRFPQSLSQVRAALLRDGRWNGELAHRRRDGAEVVVASLWVLHRDAEGNPVAIIEVNTDITARKLAESEARSLAQFPTENPNPVLRASTDGRLLFSNGPARVLLRTFGWDEGAPLPGPLLQEVRLVPERGAMQGQDVTAPDGKVWSFTLSASTGEGYVNLFGRDVTERRRSEEQLREANERLQDADRRKDEFLGMLSHELRNPLAPIRNALYILDRAKPTGEQARRAKEVANRQLGHLTRLVDDLLDVTRIARGKIELRRSDLDLAGLAHRTADDYRALMHDRGLDLVVEVPRDPVVVNGDATRLAQVLGNLLSNAAKFTPAGGRVTLELSMQAGRAFVHVRDTGAGIAPDVLPSLFQPFTQAKQTLARSEGGLGLGLALVKGLVALHGGEVNVISDGTGHGTDFVVTIPLASTHRGQPATTERREANRPGKANRRVLVIDDNRDAADTLAQLVEMLGHAPVVAYDAFEGLAKASEDLPDVVLCDIGLPGMDGYEFARLFRAMSPHHDVPLIALSGYAQPEDVAKALESGFDAHVAKPPDPEKLASLLARGT